MLSLLGFSLPLLFSLPFSTLAQISPPSDSTYISDSAFKSALLNSTNYYRAQHSAAPLAWNDSLADFAQHWTTGCVFGHSNSGNGENIASGYPSATITTDAWANEQAHYGYKSPSFDEATGHFTQLVWGATTNLGCGRNDCNGDNGTPGWYVVCEYWPAGNVEGEFAQQVLPPVKSGAGRMLPSIGLLTLAFLVTWLRI